MLYRDEATYLNGVAPFVEDALAADEPVFVAVPAANLTAVRDHLAGAGDRVGYADMGEAGANPGRILPAVLLAFAARHPGRRVRLVGEPIWPDRTALEYPACVQHEALINTAFAGRDAAILCPYDLSRLSPLVVMDAHRTHPTLVDADGRRPSRRYTDPTALAAEYNLPLPDPPVAAVSHPVAFDLLSAVRRVVVDHAAAAGLPPARVEDLTVAVNELATNSVMHGGGTGTLTIWHTNDDVVCEVTDHGHMTDPMAGRVPPSMTSVSGRGLVTVHQLCDLVRVYTRPGLTAVRVYMRRASP